MQSPRARMLELAKMPSGAPVVSMYLDTRWHDAHERAVTRRFVEEQLRRASERAPWTLRADLDWLAEQLAALLDEAARPPTPGLAFFVSTARGLREVFVLEAPIADEVVVADRPFVSPLSDALAAERASLIVLVDPPRLARTIVGRMLRLLGAHP